MTSQVSKKQRIETTYLSLKPQSLFSKKNIPQNILDYFSTFLNIHDSISLNLVCKAFRAIPTYYLLRRLNQIQKVIDCFSKVSFSHKYSQEIQLSPRWNTSFSNGLSHLKEISIHVAHTENEYGLSEKQSLQIISIAKNLIKLEIVGCTDEILQEANKSLSLIELDIKNPCKDIKLPFESQTLKKFKFNHTLESLPFDFFKQLGKDSPWPNLEYLSIHTEDDWEENMNNNKFISYFPSLQALELSGESIKLDHETFSTLLNLKKLSLNFYRFSEINISPFTFPSLETLIISLPQFMDNDNDVTVLYYLIKNSENLKKTKIIYDLSEGGIENFQNFTDIGIFLLDKVSFHVYDENFANLQCIFLNNINFSKINNAFIHTVCHLDRCDFRVYGISMYALKLIPTIKEIALTCSYVNPIDEEQNDQNEKKLMFIFYNLSERITCLRDTESFSWSLKLINYLRQNPLKNCTQLDGYFTIGIEAIPTTTLLEIFPSLTADKIDRKFRNSKKLKTQD